MLALHGSPLTVATPTSPVPVFYRIIVSTKQLQSSRLAHSSSRDTRGLHESGGGKGRNRQGSGAGKKFVRGLGRVCMHRWEPATVPWNERSGTISTAWCKRIPTASHVWMMQGKPNRDGELEANYVVTVPLGGRSLCSCLGRTWCRDFQLFVPRSRLGAESPRRWVIIRDAAALDTRTSARWR